MTTPKPTQTPPDSLICTECGTEKPLDAFHKDSNRRYGVDTKCGDCVNARRRTPKYRFSASKSNAKKRGLAWTLTFEQYCDLIDSPCEYCGNELGTDVEYAGGLDRIDNDKGYTLDNVVRCCTVCNRMRNDHLTPEETTAAAQAVLDMRRPLRALTTNPVSALTDLERVMKFMAQYQVTHLEIGDLKLSMGPPPKKKDEPQESDQDLFSKLPIEDRDAVLHNILRGPR